MAAAKAFGDVIHRCYLQMSFTDVIARSVATKQSCGIAHLQRDCFAALAMTAKTAMTAMTAKTAMTAMTGVKFLFGLDAGVACHLGQACDLGFDRLAKRFG